MLFVASGVLFSFIFLVSYTILRKYGSKGLILPVAIFGLIVVLFVLFLSSNPNTSGMF